jgi:hypothetical protein
MRIGTSSGEKVKKYKTGTVFELLYVKNGEIKGKGVLVYEGKFEDYSYWLRNITPNANEFGTLTALDVGEYHKIKEIKIGKKVKFLSSEQISQLLGEGAGKSEELLKKFIGYDFTKEINQWMESREIVDPFELDSYNKKPRIFKGFREENGL